MPCGREIASFHCADTGEVRPAPRGQERLREAAKLGFSVAVVPKANAPKKAVDGLAIHAVERIEEAIDVCRQL